MLEVSVFEVVNDLLLEHYIWKVFPSLLQKATMETTMMTAPDRIMAQPMVDLTYSPHCFKHLIYWRLLVSVGQSSDLGTPECQLVDEF